MLAKRLRYASLFCPSTPAFFDRWQHLFPGNDRIGNYFVQLRSDFAILLALGDSVCHARLQSFDRLVRLLNTTFVCFVEPACVLTAIPTEAHTTMMLCRRRQDKPTKADNTKVDNWGR
jgi:hypothetical protein